LGQPVTRVSWTNIANRANGDALGVNSWSANGIPLQPDKTNLITLTATTTSWAAGFGGNTTFNDTLTVICSPIRAALTMQGGGTVLNWTGGAPPYAVQRATDLGKSDWADLLPEAIPPVSLPMESGAGFYRVRGK